MASISEKQHAGEFLVSEANGAGSREVVTVEAGQTLKPGHVLGQVTTSGEYKEYDPASTDGSETAVAVAWDHVDASAAAKEAAIISDRAEVNAGELVWFAAATNAQKTTGQDELANQSRIKAR